MCVIAADRDISHGCDCINKMHKCRLINSKIMVLSLIVRNKQDIPLYTPGIYADGYIVFAFLFVRSYVRWLVRSFVSSFVIPERSWNLCQSFC